MVDLIAYIRSFSSKMEKVYLSPGDSQNGRKLFVQKGCIQCHSPQGKLDLSKKKDFPRTLAQLAGMMWNHSPKMWKGIEEKGIRYGPGYFLRAHFYRKRQTALGRSALHPGQQDHCRRNEWAGKKSLSPGVFAPNRMVTLP
jgi:hypothetical protein